MATADPTSVALLCCLANLLMVSPAAGTTPATAADPATVTGPSANISPAAAVKE